ncbi:acyl-CoA dehydrogenase family protein [Actinospongicola halichondriae]|uniref:acyl-CoA dehydrogenase family protein n=1 Tax=Actinospongicola halichondriae TaxID=3236844 RepID=UPI003D4A3E0F
MTAVETQSSAPGTDARRVEDAVDAFLAANDPSAMDKVEYRGALYDAGLAWVHFPEGWGGLGVPPTLQRIVDAKTRAAGAPNIDPTQFFGLALAGPTVVSHASDDLKSRSLRRMFTGEDSWCQLFSEPGAGSDLAGLACKAVRDGDEWIVTGQKVWNTMAHLADKGMLVARTDPDQPKHKGLTYFMVDMHAPGVEVRPLRQITGEAEFNEVYLTEVRIPDADRIGDVGDGWRVSMTTLMNERTSIGGGGGSGPRPAGSGPIAEVVRIWQEELADHERKPATRDKLMDLWIRAEVLRLTNVRANQNRKAGNPGPESSIAKLAIALINKDIYAFCVDMLGAQGLIGYDFDMRRADAVGLEGPPGSSRKMFLRSRANSIEGGTSEIMKNILGERVLGLPGEPRVDKEMAWKDVPR